MAMVTDYDSWKADEEHVTIEMIIENLHRNAELAKAVVKRTIPRIPTQPTWSCHDALKNAILTDRKFWPAKTKRELAPLLKKYL
jgi:5'-methylthioadenosine phosphorylase